MSYDPGQFAFIDTETLGLHPEGHAIWEIGVIVDGVEHVWQQVVSKGELDEASEVALEMTHFHERYDGTTAITPFDSIRRFVDLTEGRHLVGMVPSFDSERLHRLWRRWRPQDQDWAMPWHYHLIDVETLVVGALLSATQILDETVPRLTMPWDSEELSKIMGVEPPDEFERHSALADARWAKRLFEAVVLMRRDAP